MKSDFLEYPERYPVLTLIFSPKIGLSKATALEKVTIGVAKRWVLQMFCSTAPELHRNWHAIMH